MVFHPQAFSVSLCPIPVEHLRDGAMMLMNLCWYLITQHSQFSHYPSSTVISFMRLSTSHSPLQETNEINIYLLTRIHSKNENIYDRTFALSISLCYFSVCVCLCVCSKEIVSILCNYLDAKELKFICI